MDHNYLDSVYGAFADLNPEDAARLMTGFERLWWIGGGWALDAFTATSRRHADIDICIAQADVNHVLAHFAGTHHVWAVGSGAMKPLLSHDPAMPDFAGQLWVRKSAHTPWLLDMLLTPVAEGTWAFKRDLAISLPIESATWVTDDGIRYERPEISLLHKAKHDRPKDRADLERTLPLLQAEQVEWFSESLARVHPDHPWLERLA